MTANIEPDQGKRYLDERLSPQITWLEARATRAKRMHYILGTVQIVLASIVPFLNSLVRESPSLIYVSSAVSAGVAIAAGFSTFGSFHGDWVRYRQVANELSSVRYKFEHGIAPFDGADRLAKLVTTSEDLMLGESSRWTVDKSRPDR